MMDVPPQLRQILSETPELKRSYLVGGCVRDALLGLPVKDYDVEVFGVDYDALVGGLARWGRAELVGRSFGTVKLRIAEGTEVDFALPRRDAKVGAGHRGFDIVLEPGLDLAAAAARRDFTFNALMYDPRAGVLHDFNGGQRDLADRILRHNGAAFPEDPLRVLRGMQLASRFALTPAAETVALCRAMRGTYVELAPERVREEWMKWATRSVRPSAGLHFLAATGWLAHFPELADLCGVVQDVEWHPEGDVFTHTAQACDALVELVAWREADPETRAMFSWAVLTHDFGKPSTTQRVWRDGRERIVSPGHEEAGVPVAERFLARLQVPLGMQERILPLVRHHLAHLSVPTERSVRRLARRLMPATIDQLAVVITADASGRPPRPRGVPAGLERLRELAAAMDLARQAPRPLLQGRHLIRLGLSPGPRFGPILAAAFEAQLEGAFGDGEGARVWLRESAGQWGIPPEALARLEDPRMWRGAEGDGG